MNPLLPIQTMQMLGGPAIKSAAALDTSEGLDPGNRRCWGLVRGVSNHHPIAEPRVGLLPLGVSDVTTANLIVWGGTNSEGHFEVNKPTVLVATR